MPTFNRFLCLKLTLNIVSIYFSLRLLIWKTLSNSGTFLILRKNWFQMKFFQLIKKPGRHFYFIFLPFWSESLTEPSWRAAWGRPWQLCWCLLRSSPLSSCPEWRSCRPSARWGWSPGAAWTWRSGRAPLAEECRSASQTWHQNKSFSKPLRDLRRPDDADGSQLR